MWTLTIYGSNTDISTDYPDKTAVEALSDVVNSSLSVSSVTPKFNLDGGETEYLDKDLYDNYTIRAEFELHTEFAELPATNTPFTSFIPLTVLKKKYKWLYLNNYPIKPDTVSSTTTKVVPIAITGFQINYDSGFNELIINCKNRNAE